MAKNRYCTGCRSLSPCSSAGNADPGCLGAGYDPWAAGSSPFPFGGSCCRTWCTGFPAGHEDGKSSVRKSPCIYSPQRRSSAGLHYIWKFHSSKKRTSFTIWPNQGLLTFFRARITFSLLNILQKTKHFCKVIRCPPCYNTCRFREDSATVGVFCARHSFHRKRSRMFRQREHPKSLNQGGNIT